MTLPGLTGTTAYSITRDKDGKIVNNRNTYEFSAAARKNLTGATRSTSFSASSSVRPTTVYANGANSRLGKFGYEMGPDGRIRSNQNFSDLRAGNGSSGQPTIITINSNSGTCQSTGVSGGNSIGDVVAAATNLYSVLNQVGAIDAIKNGISANGIFSSGGSNSSSGTDSLSAMKDCKDSTSLRAAIDTARAEKTKIDTDLSKLQGEIGGMETAANDAKEKLEGESGLNAQVKKQEDVVKDKTTALDDAKTKKTYAEGTKKRNAETLEVAKDALGEASKALDAATTKLSNAKVALANTPKTTIGPDGTEVPNEPAYSNAQKAVQTAQEELKQAADNLKQKEKEKATAVDNYTRAAEAFTNAKKGVVEAENNIKEAKAELEKQQAQLNDLKKQQNELKGKIETFENTKKQIEDLKDKSKEYQEAIDKQDKRLQELETQEAKDLAKLTKDVDSGIAKVLKREGEINDDDGMSIREKIKANKNDRANEKLAKKLIEQEELQKKVDVTNLYRNSQPTTFTGSSLEFRSGNYSTGDKEAFYMIGSRVVDKATYQREFEKAKNAASAA